MCQYHTICEKQKNFPLRSGTTEVCAFLPLIRHSTGSYTQAIREQKNKRCIIGEEEIELLPFNRGHDTIYRNPKDVTKILLEQINKLSKVAGFKKNQYTDIHCISIHW